MIPSSISLFSELDLWKRDNIQMFANATLHFGVPKSAVMNYSFFESKNVAMWRVHDD